MTFELPSGLPERPWAFLQHPDLTWFVVGPDGALANFITHETIARAIASIPDMVEEIGQLRKNSTYQRIVELENEIEGGLEQVRSLQAFNAALATELTNICERLKKCALNSGTSEEYAELAVARARALLAKPQEPAA